METGVTFTIGGQPVTEKILSDRLDGVAFVRDYRLEQLGRDSYRIQILPEPDKDRRSIRGAVLDALVDVYGQGRFDIDIIEEDDALMPEISGEFGRTRITRAEYAKIIKNKT